MTHPQGTGDRAGESPGPPLALTGGAARPDRLINVLAQTPERVRLDAGAVPDPRLRLLARAYGVEDRVVGGPAGERVDMDGAGDDSIGTIVERLRRPGERAAHVRGDDAIFAGTRIAVVTNIPAPYRTSLWNALAERLTAAGAAFAVVFQGAGSSKRPWMAGSGEARYDAIWLRAAQLPVGERGRLVPADLGRRLREFRPTLVISAGFSPAATMRVVAHARRHRAVFGLWSGDIEPPGGRAAPVQAVQRRWVLRHSDFGVAYSSPAAEYLRAIRPDLPVVNVRNTSDVAADARERSSGPVRLLVVGDLGSTRKGVDVVLEALRLRRSLDCTLDVVGGGALLDRLRSAAADDSRIHFHGALPAAEVRGLYGRSDVFLFPTRSDVFGLALVEAMASGLACLSSGRPGAIGDMGVHGRTCMIVEGHDPEDWAAAIERLVEDRELREGLAERGRDAFEARWTIAHSADAWIAGMRLGLLLRDAPPMTPA